MLAYIGRRGSQLEMGDQLGGCRIGLESYFSLSSNHNNTSLPLVVPTLTLCNTGRRHSKFFRIIMILSVSDEPYMRNSIRISKPCSGDGQNNKIQVLIIIQTLRPVSLLCI